MDGNINHVPTGPSPELERNRLVEKHRQLDEEWDTIGKTIESFLQETYRGPENETSIRGQFERREKIQIELAEIEEVLFRLRDS